MKKILFTNKNSQQRQKSNERKDSHKSVPTYCGRPTCTCTLKLLDCIKKKTKPVSKLPNMMREWMNLKIKVTDFFQLSY